MPASFPPTTIDQHSPKICLELYCSALAMPPKGTTTMEGIGSKAETSYNTCMLYENNSNPLKAETTLLGQVLRTSTHEEWTLS
jgi:hypothetical protein